MGNPREALRLANPFKNPGGNELICQNCGAENPNDFKFCSKCGKEIIKPLPLGDPKLKTQRENLRKVILRRDKTDMVIQPMWVIALVAIVIVLSLSSIVMILAEALDIVNDYPDSEPPFSVFVDRAMPAVYVLAFQSIIYGAALALLTVLLIRRLNNHIKRENLLREQMGQLLEGAAGSSSRDTMIRESFPGVSSQDPIPWEFKISFAWAIVPLIPTFAALLEIWFMDTHTITSRSDLSDYTVLSYGLTAIHIAFQAYVFYFLGKTISYHDSTWSLFAQDSRSAMNYLGFPHGRAFNVSTIERRSFLLYFVLSVITLGLWTYYWWYTLVKDPNTHFTKQWDFEDNIVDALDKAEGVMPAITQ